MDAKYKHRWYILNRERILLNRKKYRLENIVKIRANDRKRNAIRRKNEEYKEHMRRLVKKWQRKNRHRLNARRRETRIRKPIVRKTKEQLAIKARLRQRKYYYKHKKRPINAMKEKDFGILFRHWIKANPQKTASFELKDTRGESCFYFSMFEDHQVAFANAIKKNEQGILIRVQGINGEPDYVYMRKTPAYIVIKYPHFFVLIPIDKFIKEKSRSKRKSLTGERAKEIGFLSVNI